MLIRLLSTAAVCLCLSASLVAQAVPVPELTLRAGDVINVSLPREPRLSGDFPVDERGVVSLPIIGSRMVTGSPWAIVRDSLLMAYARELADPSVGLLARHRVFVLGSVNRPGVVLADPSVTLAGAVAMAGGATAEGDLTRVRVIRDGVTIVARGAIDSPLIQAGIRSGDQLFVERRPWLDRNSGIAVSAFVGLLGVVATILIVR